MAVNYFALSNFDTHVFFEAFTDTDTIPTQGTHELEGCISENLGQVTKDIQTYKTLDGNGWDTIVSLGQSQAEATLSFIRTGTGNIYTGQGEGDSTYTTLKNWSDNSTAQGGSNAPMCLVEVLPRGTGYEGTCYYVVPTSFTPNERNTTDGQLFDVGVQPFGPPVPVVVTKGEDGIFTFAKPTTGAAS